MYKKNIRKMYHINIISTSTHVFFILERYKIKDKYSAFMSEWKYDLLSLKKINKVLLSIIHNCTTFSSPNNPSVRNNNRNEANETLTDLFPIMLIYQFIYVYMQICSNMNNILFYLTFLLVLSSFRITYNLNFYYSLSYISIAIKRQGSTDRRISFMEFIVPQGQILQPSRL